MKFEVTHLHAVAQMGGMGATCYMRFLAAGGHDRRHFPTGDLLHAERHGAKP